MIVVRAAAEGEASAQKGLFERSARRGARRNIRFRAPALPARCDSGGGSEGAVEAPFDGLARVGIGPDNDDQDTILITRAADKRRAPGLSQDVHVQLAQIA